MFEFNFFRFPACLHLPCSKCRSFSHGAAIGECLFAMAGEEP